ncbi:MAG: MFS transporter, partial [Solirubrobacteraceae bacterium]
MPARSGESSEAGGAPSLTAKASRARVSVTVLFIILGVLDATWASRIPLIRERLHLSDLGLSLALAGPAVGLVVSTRLATAIVDRIGNKRAARRAAVASAAFSVLPGIAPDLVLLAISLAVWGACLGTLDITMNAQGSALERTEGRSLMSRLHASYSMAILAFAAVGALAARLNVAPPVHFLLIGGVCVVLVVLCTRALPDDPDPGPAAPSPASAQARRSLIGYPRLMALAAIGFCALLTEGAVINWS